MKRNYDRLDSYYKELMDDIYPQPVNFDKYDMHYSRASTAILWAMHNIHPASVLDVGCGEGFCQELFMQYDVGRYIGVSLGEDCHVAWANKRNVLSMDFNFLSFDDESFDLVFSRHSLEHSPFPLLTLMEWHRVAKHWLCLIMPNPKTATYFGRNHYYVVGHPSQIRWMLRRAGWRVLHKQYDDFEYRFICEKLPRVGYEGWAEIPLDGKIMDDDREDEEGLWR